MEGKVYKNDSMPKLKTITFYVMGPTLLLRKPKEIGNYYTTMDVNSNRNGLFLVLLDITCIMTMVIHYFLLLRQLLHLFLMLMILMILHLLEGKFNLEEIICLKYVVLYVYLG